MTHVLPVSASVEGPGHLTIGGRDTVELADEFGTPLVVMCRDTIEDRAAGFARVVGADHVFYAAKAFCCVAMCQLVDALGLGLDVCTGGELATALRAGFPPDRIVFHGNNKSAREIADAAAAGVGRFVADSFEELERLEDLHVRTKLSIRVNPGVEAHTHEFVQTGQEDSKFGFALAEDVALEALRMASGSSYAEVVGVHFHIGSQILELEAFDVAVERVADFLAGARRDLGFTARELNLGGGFGIAHTADEGAVDPADAVRRLQDVVRAAFAERDIPVPELFVEPGRALIGPAAVTLYEVGTVKEIRGVRTYVSVDGGMSDNIRPALYGAGYEGFLANRVHAEPSLRARVVGKHCESGDVLIDDAALPHDVRPGDLLCIPATGAYTYSMASNYNRMPRPAVVLVENGRAVEIVRRETYDDVLRADRRLDGSSL